MFVSINAPKTQAQSGEGGDREREREHIKTHSKNQIRWMEDILKQRRRIKSLSPHNHTTTNNTGRLNKYEMSKVNEEKTTKKDNTFQK